MRLLISIPKEFEQHWQADKFEDSLHRLSADAHLSAGNYEQETAVMLIRAFKTAVPVPPHGDLIDQEEYRDEFMDGVYDLCNDDPDNNRANAIIDLFDTAPTIIPADPPKEEA